LGKVVEVTENLLATTSVKVELLLFTFVSKYGKNLGIIDIVMRRAGIG
jgi:hypothetical protein